MLSFWSWTLAAVIALAFAPLTMKMALSVGGSPLQVAFITALFAALVVCGWLLLRNKARGLPRMPWRQRLALLLVGALSAGLVPLFGILAMTETSASNRALFQSAYPAATALAARLLLGERLGPFSYMLIGLVCSGLVLMNLEPAPGLSMLGWPFWLLLATLPLIGLADVIAKKNLVDQPPEVVAAGRLGHGHFCRGPLPGIRSHRGLDGRQPDGPCAGPDPGCRGRIARGFTESLAMDRLRAGPHGAAVAGPTHLRTGAGKPSYQDAYSARGGSPRSNNPLGLI